MRNMLALFGAALITVVSAGWYLGWYKVRSQPASVPGQHSVNIDINTNKITSDLQQSEQRLQQWLDKKNNEDSKKADGGLMLPSPSGNKSNGNSRSMFPFHSDKGGSLNPGGETKPPRMLIGGGQKK